MEQKMRTATDKTYAPIKQMMFIQKKRGQQKLMS